MTVLYVFIIAFLNESLAGIFLSAVAAYGRIPPPLRLVLDGMANKVKQTPIQFVEQALKDSSLAAVMAEVEKRYTQQVKGKGS